MRWLAYVRRRLYGDPGFYAPRVAVLCPCKGIEPGLERNLVSLTEFERQNYEIFFILASEKDPARSIIERVAKSSRVKTKIVIAGKARNFCWGGGTAIRRATFEQSGVLEEWKNSVSDDYSLTRALERTGRSIVFIPESLTISYVETDFAGLLEFTNRQILITRVYAS